jgi:DNA-binding transcriptional LysR family regulator
VSEARRLLQKMEFIERLVRRATRGGETTLTIGHTGPALFRILPRALDILRARFPHQEVQLDELSSEDQIKRLRDGRLDLAVTSSTPIDLQGLAVRPVERSRFIAALPADWSLAARKELHLAELKDCPFVMTRYERSPGSRTAFFAACLAAGFTPRVVQDATQINTRLALVSGGVGVAIVPETAQCTDYHGVRFLPIVDMQDDILKFELSIVWVPHSVNRPLRTLIECFGKASGDLETVPVKIIAERLRLVPAFASRI